jgi:hypothetical protein
MLRVLFFVFACLWLGGCVTNNLSTQNALVAPASAALPARPQLPPAPNMTPAARLANAKMITVNKTTKTGTTLVLASPQSLAIDCSPLGEVDAKIIAPPDHGTVDIVKGMAFSNYTPGDPPYLCNAKKSPATLITYRSTPGFSGQDTVSVQIFFPEGRAPTVIFHLDVR